MSGDAIADEFEVERITGYKQAENKLVVKWVGCDIETEEPVENLIPNASEKLVEYFISIAVPFDINSDGYLADSEQVVTNLVTRALAKVECIMSFIKLDDTSSAVVGILEFAPGATHITLSCNARPIMKFFLLSSSKCDIWLDPIYKNFDTKDINRIGFALYSAYLLAEHD